MNTNKVLKVVGITAPKEAKNGNGSFKTVTVRQYNLLSVGNKVIEAATANEASRNIWTDRQTKDGQGTVKGSPLYNDLELGSYISGEVMRFNTTPHNINGKEVRTRKVLVFEGENAIRVGNSELASELAAILDDDGNSTVDLKELAKKQQSVTA